MTDTPRLLRYTKLAARVLHDGELWVAITSGSPGQGGNGIVVWGSCERLVGHDNRQIEPALMPGSSFQFAANKDYDERGTIGGRAIREVWGLDSDQVPTHVAAAWMKLMHTGKLHAPA